jgi:hypothetical protein
MRQKQHSVHEEIAPCNATPIPLRHADDCLRCCMIALDTLHQLPLKEKLFVMEALWDCLSQTGAELPVPPWHQAVLDEREAQIAGGTAKFVDWETAKQEIRAAVQ